MEMMPLKIHNGQPDAILMDVQMLNKTVIRLEEIRKINGSKNIPIIAVTAGILLGEKENANQNG
jgi:CheY-like chemotaxis protein